MNRIVGDPLGFAWVRYLMVAIVVVGVGQLVGRITRQLADQACGIP
jgi:hypothetical protein